MDDENDHGFIIKENQRIPMLDDESRAMSRTLFDDESPTSANLGNDLECSSIIIYITYGNNFTNLKL